MKERCKEHLANARLEKQGTSSLSDHLIETKHGGGDCVPKLLRTCTKGRKMNFSEQLEIETKKGTGQLLNSQIESQVAPLIFPHSLMEARKHRSVAST